MVFRLCLVKVLLGAIMHYVVSHVIIGLGHLTIPAKEASFFFPYVRALINIFSELFLSCVHSFIYRDENDYHKRERENSV